MQQKLSLKLLPQEASDHHSITRFIAKKLGVRPHHVTGYYIVKKSIDARAKIAWIHLTLIAFINEPFTNRPEPEFHFKDVHLAKRRVVIIGAGPAGLFAALQLIESGIKPVIIERGKDVKERRRDLAVLNKKGIINPESNYCFGEGGAGTYSDGKLYTRSNKRGNIDRILHLFVHFGADANILFEAHPHIGTNKLPRIITAMRTRILDCGGEIHFNKKLADFTIEGEKIIAAKTYDADVIPGDAFILATGHSARDIFKLLHKRNLAISAKPFALGVRIEHPQELINSIQYGSNGNNEYLPPASYSLVEQVDHRGVFSFCMCPGGIIAPASTSEGELVVNGWSPSKRNNPYANSGMVVQTEPEDVPGYLKKTGRKTEAISPLTMMYFQQEVESNAFTAGGGKFAAPAQRLVDFANNVFSGSLPRCSYPPGVRSASLKEVLPGFITHRLQKALLSFAKKMPAYFTNEAILVATE
ncbi:MAG TPA: NAD(P)/FAD-dependent oxidoreductase, partial [Chitinophagaceae bacterium]|nr:NAD(P)/FAD-dependent oxidoreductase [Chitinophagaceae bacterium]